MKRIIKTNIFIVVMAIMLSVGTYFAEDPPEDYNPQQKSTIAAIYTDKGETAAYERIVDYMNNAVQKPTSNLIQLFINHGLFPNYVDELKALGFTDVDYSPVLGGGSKSNTTQQVTQTPEPFTVEPYNPAKTMWATSEVNCRTGAGTSYQKVGSLKKHEEVKVTGCQTAHCGRYKPHFIFGGLASPIMPYRNLPQTTDGMTADCRSLVWKAAGAAFEIRPWQESQP